MTAIRSLFAGALALLCLAGPIPPAGAASPVVPLVSNHQAWDHHWFVWLPRHPLYESVEIMSVERPAGGFRAVWVFFTERAGNKRQIHFLDNRRLVDAFEGSHYRPIVYRRSGAPGRAQSVRVALKGQGDESIEIAVDLADRPLTAKWAGLTDQSGHGADTIVLLFYRDRNALAHSNEVRISGRDYSFRPGGDPMGKHRFKAAYSAGIQVAVIPFGRWAFARLKNGLSAPADGISFTAAARDGGLRLQAPVPGYRNRITVDLDAAGAFVGYQHSSAGQRLALSLDGALPLAPGAPQAARRFTVYIKPDKAVARGQVVSAPAADGRRLTWRFLAPRWAAAYPFESLIRPNGSGYTLTIRSLRQ
ncbi:MAG: hypothetical protein OXC10_03455 [Rhodospirillaceae bacterium]|nr:hypothetical protein [Rhodospirillaceae bacterium]